MTVVTVETVVTAVTVVTGVTVVTVGTGVPEVKKHILMSTIVNCSSFYY